MKNLFILKTDVKTGRVGSIIAAARILRALRRLTIMGAVFIGAVACASESDSQREAADAIELTEMGAPSKGFAYAKENCASCHAVEAGQPRSPNPAAPTFESLANRQDMTRMALSALLRTPHRTMPNLVVEPDRIDDLSAYLYTLKRNDAPR